MRHSAAFWLMLISVSTNASFAQEKTNAVNLLSRFAPATSPRSGDWSVTSDGLQVEPAKACRAFLANDLPPSFELHVEFTRVSGNDVVALILPVGKTSVALELSSWGGEAHGIARVDEQTSRSASNPTSVRPGQLKNGQRYQLDVQVSVGKEDAEIQALLDSRMLIDWKGKTTRLQPHLIFNLPEESSLGLVSHQNRVIFHRVELKKASGRTVKPPKSSPAGPTDSSASSIQLADLGTPEPDAWQPFNGARFTTSESDGAVVVSTVPGAGSGDRGAFVKNLSFTTGTIEVDIRGDARPQQSFAGVVFGGVNRETYESIYFRSFNFGSADEERRSHAVQYIAHPDWPWNRLRAERTGQFEKAVTPEPRPDEWFHARIQVTDDTVRVFVNDSDRPSLQVKRLADRRSGKVGLWFNGIASFRNFTVTPDARK